MNWLINQLIRPFNERGKGWCGVVWYGIPLSVKRGEGGNVFGWDFLASCVLLLEGGVVCIFDWPFSLA